MGLTFSLKTPILKNPDPVVLNAELRPLTSNILMGHWTGPLQNVVLVFRGRC